MFEEDHHTVLQREEHRHGTLIALYTSESLNTCQCELRKCLIPMKSALSKKLLSARAKFTLTMHKNLLSSKKNDGKIISMEKIFKGLSISRDKRSKHGKKSSSSGDKGQSSSSRDKIKHREVSSGDKSKDLTSKGDFTRDPDLYITPERQQKILELREQFSFLDDIETLDDLLALVPSKYHQTVIDACDGAERAFDKLEERETMKPEELAALVKGSYKVKPIDTKEGIEYRFDSKKHLDKNHATMVIDADKGILSTDLIYHGVKDGLHPSDFQRYACIDSNGENIPINEYRLYGIRNRNTKDVMKALYYASINLNPDRAKDGTLDLAGNSAAFRVFLGAKLNLSNIYFGQDMGLNIQSVAIQKANEELMRYQLTFS